ncbi:uncharacterized protein ISCGN_022634 [Ixodes scapularis]
MEVTEQGPRQCIAQLCSSARTSPFRRWQAQVPWEMRPVPQDIYKQQKELRTSQPDTDPVDMSDEESDSEDMYSDALDTSYRPNDSIDSDEELDSPDTSPWNDSVTSDDEGPDAECSTSATTTNPVKERKFIVCASMLLQLLSVCRECLAPTHTSLKERGTLLHAVTVCVRGHKTVWESQPRINGKALMNLLLPAAITFSGASPTRVIRLLSSVGVAVLQKSQLFLIQGCLVFPAAAKVWKEEQTTLLTAMRGSKLHLAGDGRADSPGYSAKYGTYTLLETNINKILHFEVIQSTEVKSSNNMETEGLKRSFDHLQGWGFCPHVLVTDRHFGVNALMKSNYPNTKHRFDAWHVAKGIGSKLALAGKTKRNSLLNKWVKTVRAHVYWCAQTSDDNGALVLAKWMSLMRHVDNVHQHPDPLYPACTHAPIVEERWWLHKGTEPYDALEKVVMSRQLLKDIPKLSGDGQTYRLESFHSLLLRFTPKSSHFSLEGMEARTAIAVLHYNANSDRKQATTKDGKDCFVLKFPKARKGEWVVNRKMEPASYDYTQKLFGCFLELAEGVRTYQEAQATYVPRSRGKSLCSVSQRPNKEAAVLAHRSRFST